MKKLLNFCLFILLGLVLQSCPPTSQFAYYYVGPYSHTATFWREYEIKVEETSSVTITTGTVTDYTKQKELGLFTKIADTTGVLQLEGTNVYSTSLGVLKKVTTSQQFIGTHPLHRPSKNTYHFYLKVDQKRAFDLKNDSIIVKLPSKTELIFVSRKSKHQ